MAGFDLPGVAIRRFCILSDREGIGQMPYSMMDPRIKGLPPHAKEIWVAAAESAMKQYGDVPAKVMGTAWAAVKKAGYTQDEKGNWHAPKGKSESVTRPAAVSGGMTIPGSLIEAAFDPETRTVRNAILVEAGKTRTGKRYYPERVLAAAAHLYEGAKSYSGHGSMDERKGDKEREPQDWIAHIENARFENAGGRSKLRGDIRFIQGNTKADEIVRMLEDPAVMRGMGLSHFAFGDERRGVIDSETLSIVEAIHRVKSVDLVTEPNAGGRLQESYLAEAEIEETRRLTMNSIEEIRAAYPDLMAKHDAEARATIEAEIRAAIDSEGNNGGGSNDDKAGGNEPWKAVLESQRKEFQEEIARMRSETQLAQVLAEVPEKAAAMIRESIRETDPAKLVEAAKEKVKAFNEALEEQVQAGRPRGMGSGGAKSKTFEESAKAADEAMSALLGFKGPEPKKEGEK